MIRSKLTKEQVAFALRQVGIGTKMSEIGRQLGISQGTFHAWRKKCSGLGLAELRRPKQREHENGRFKQHIADLSLDKEKLQRVVRKKL